MVLATGTSILAASDKLGWPNLSVSLVNGHAHDYELTHETKAGLWIGMPLEPMDV
jgi:hypothetical protein